MLVPGGAFTQAMAVYAGQNYGAGRVDRTKISMTSSIIELSNRLIWAMILKNIIFEAAVWWNEPPAFFLAGLFSYLCFFFYKKWQAV